MAGLPSAPSVRLPSAPSLKLPAVPGSALSSIGSFRLGKFIPKPYNFPKLAATPAMTYAMNVRAEDVAAIARRIAPVGETGDYRDSIEAVSGNGDNGLSVGRVNAGDYKAWWIEYGTVKWAGHGTLRRAADEYGLRVEAKRGG